MFFEGALGACAFYWLYVGESASDYASMPHDTHLLDIAGRTNVHHTMRFGSTAKVLLKCKLKYYRISECTRPFWRMLACTQSTTLPGEQQHACDQGVNRPQYYWAYSLYTVMLYLKSLYTGRD